MLRIYRDYAHDGDISYGDYGSRNHLDIWRRPDLVGFKTATDGRRCWCRFPVAPGSPETNGDKHTR